jgi:hypothetical protein
MATVMSVGLPLRVYIYEEGRLLWGTTQQYTHTNFLDATHCVQPILVPHCASTESCVQPIPVPPSTSTESVEEKAFEIAVRRETLPRVCGRSGFWGVYSRLLASSARPALIKFLVANTDHGTALRTSAYVHCIRLY